LIHKKVDVRTMSVCKNFGDNLKDGIEETYRPKFIDQRNTFLLQNESNQCIVETMEVNSAIVKLCE